MAYARAYFTSGGSSRRQIEPCSQRRVLPPKPRGALFGLKLRHGRGHLYRALLESTANGVRHNLEIMADAMGSAPSWLVAVGAAHAARSRPRSSPTSRAGRRNFPERTSALHMAMRSSPRLA